MFACAVIASAHEYQKVTCSKSVVNSLYAITEFTCAIVQLGNTQVLVM